MAGEWGRRALDKEPSGFDQVRTRADFAALLDRLRTDSNLTYRALGEQSDNPWSTVRDWCLGKVLPARGQDERFRQLLGVLGFDDPEPLMATLVRLRSRGASQVAPYPGLQSFGRTDADWFFGRTALVDEAVDLHRRLEDDIHKPRLMWVVGASGAGKSSLIHAGLCPAVESRGHGVVSTTPGEKPIERLAGALAEPFGVPQVEAADGLGADPAAWLASLNRAEPGTVDLLVVIDQFEELFRACDDPAERQRFVAAVAALADPASASGCAVAAGLRIELYGEVAARAELAGSLQASQILVRPMSRDQLRAAIEEPAARAGSTVERELVTVLLDDFVPSGSLGGTHDPGALPLMGHALRETWNRARRREMTLRDYAATGGIRGAVEGTAQRIYDELDDRGQDLVRQVFLRLVHVQGDGLATRRVAPLAELQALDPPDPPPNGAHGGDEHDGRDARDGRGAQLPVSAIVDRFVDARLLTAGESTVEIAHESLLAAWPRLTGWIDEDREALRLHRSIGDAAAAWREAGDDPELLARGMRLEAMRAWSDGASRRLRLNQDEQAFLAASRAAAAKAEETRRRRTRRLRALAALASAFALLAGSLAVLFYGARTDAITARDEALSRQIAVNAENLRSTDSALAAQLSVAGYRVAPTSEARSALLGSSAAPASTRYLGGAGSTALAVSERGGLVAASNSDDGTVQLFTRAGNRLTRAGVIDLDVADLEIYALALTPDDRTLVVGDAESRITVWDVADPSRPQQLGDALQGPDGPIQALSIDPAGDELAAVGEGDGTFRWDIDDVGDPAAPERLPTLPAGDITWGVAYHPGGDRLAVGLETGEVHMWDVAGRRPRRLATLRAGDGSVFDVAFAPDGDMLAAGTKDGTVQAWDVADPRRARRLDVADAQFESWVNTVAFSPDGAHLAAGSSDLSLRVWDTSSWSLAQTLPHPAAVTQAVFTADDQSLLTAAVDGTTRVWDLPASLPVRVTGRAWGLAYAAGGDRFAAFSGEESRIWDTGDGEGEGDLHGEPVTQLGVPEGAQDALSGGSALNAEGTLLALGTQTGPVYLVDVSDPARPALLGEPLGGSDALVETVAFSPDGNLLAAGGQDTDIRIWDISDPGRPRLTATIEDPVEGVLNLGWSPTDEYLAAASADNRVYLYDVADAEAPEPLARLGGFDSEAYAAAFSPDGNLLATGGSDTFVLLWDVSDPHRPEQIGEPLDGPVARVFDLAFDPRGTRLAGAVVDGTAWVWDIDTGDMGTGDIDADDPAGPERHAVLGPAESPLSVVEFSPGGDTLAASGADGLVRLWSMDDSAVVDDVCARAGDPITVAEWETYFPDTGYDPPCRR